MRKLVCTLLAATAALTPLGTAQAESWGINLVARIPVICTINYSGAPGADNGSMVSLGSLHEFCNAPTGYQLVVNYTPGSMRGARIVAGEHEIILDGSGQNIVGNSPVPRNREIALAAAPGQNGFDTDRLEFRLDPGNR